MPTELQLAALEVAGTLKATPSNLERVAKSTSIDAARWAFGQIDLRTRAKGRFPDAERLLFVREALEQATHPGLAAYHASLFPVGALVADLTTGIGGDLIALARRGPVIGFELDPERADLARWNLAALGLEGEIREEDGLAWATSEKPDYFLVDPARRVDGKRTLDLNAFQPNPSALAVAGAQAKRSVMKLTPMLMDDLLTSLARRVEFLSLGGECREALLIGGSEALDEGMWAVRPGLPPLPRDVRGLVEADLAHGWLHDADPAAVRAHALAGFGLHSLGDHPGYLVGPNRIESPWLRAYQVIDDVTPKKLKATLKSLEADAPILKQRGAGQDLDRWRKELGKSGKRSVAVAFYARGSAVRAAILEPENLT